MTSHSFTSSSSALFERDAECVPNTIPRRRPLRTRGGARTARITAILSRLPTGALAAVLFVGLFHLLVSVWIVPHPIAREALRNKIVALTEHHRPSLLIAGDSRAQRHLIPEVVADQLGLTPDNVVNIASASCESPVVVAAYREFAGRFTSAPIMVISVSIYSINDRANEPSALSKESLWSLGLVDRLRLATLPRALAAIFLPERELYRRLVIRPREPSPAAVPERGFVGIAEDRCIDSTPEGLRPAITYVNRVWFNNAEIDGVRWRQLQADLHNLIDAGVQVVIMNSPDHPAYLQAIAGTSMDTANTEFRRQLSDLCQRLNVPLLHYDADWANGCDPDTLFYDVLHLNRRGAAILSERVGRDINDLIRSGRLRLPQSDTLGGHVEP